MADDWLTAGEPEADDDWLTDGVAAESKDAPSAEAEAAAGGGGDDDEDWLASSVEYTAAEVLYGSPCGFAVPLGHTYWCEQSQRLISEQVRSETPVYFESIQRSRSNDLFAQCTTKEIDSFLSPDCNQIYVVEQAEMFENKCAAAARCSAAARAPVRMVPLRNGAVHSVRRAQVSEQLRVPAMSMHVDHYERGENRACPRAVSVCFMYCAAIAVPVDQLDSAASHLAPP